MSENNTPTAHVEAMTAAFQTGDLDSVMQSYEAEAAVAFEPNAPVSDPAMMREIFSQWMSMNPSFTYAGHDVIEAGDLALHIAPWTMTGTAPDGTAIEQSGLSVSVMRKQSDGSWRLVIDNPHGAQLLAQN